MRSDLKWSTSGARIVKTAPAGRGGRGVGNGNAIAVGEGQRRIAERRASMDAMRRCHETSLGKSLGKGFLSPSVQSARTSLEASSK